MNSWNVSPDSPLAHQAVKSLLEDKKQSFEFAAVMANEYSEDDIHVTSYPIEQPPKGGLWNYYRIDDWLYDYSQYHNVDLTTIV